jgi:hypothetical protein
MPAIPGSVSVTGILAPTDTTDTYAVTDPGYGIDGLRSVADLAARNAIPDARRRFGMLVFTQSDQMYWTLKVGPWSGTDSDWTALTLSASTTVAYRRSFTNADLSAGILSVTHSLGQKYVTVTIYDDNDKQIIPSEISLQNTTQLQIDFTGFGAISGTWNLVVIG